ncbi:MAG: type IV secretory system conjugative DNA transfer family protein [Alphaproteobacteria bacterium]|nr:type IV secretory system conjugative DNA transfer family protein [Alphaproteobacteria bacterium]
MKFNFSPRRQPAVYFGERVRRDGNGDDTFTGETVHFAGDEHVLLIGPTRSGKGRSILAPNLILDTSRSALVVDPKGELAGWTAKHREAAGHEVIYLDPFRELAKDKRLNTAGRPAESLGFNPLRFLDPDSPSFIDDAMGIAEALVQIETHGESFWSASAQDFVAGLVMDECLGTGKRGLIPSLESVRRSICATSSDIAKDATGACDENPDTFIPNKLARFKDAANPERRDLSSIISHAQTETRFLDSPLIAEDLAKGVNGNGVVFDFGMMKKKLMTVYLVIPPAYLVTHAKWLRLIIDSAIRAMQRVRKEDSKHDVQFILDEFAQYGRLNSIETSIALNAGYGIKIFAVVQSLSQLKHLYRDNWETIVSGGVIASFAPRDAFTSEYLSRLSGQEYTNIKSESRSREGRSESVSEHLQPVLFPHELRRMARGMMILFLPMKDGQKMWRSHAPDFSELPEIAGQISGA